MPTCWRDPVRALKRVVFPALGFPPRATQIFIGLSVDLHFDVVGFVVAQGQGKALDPQGHWIVKRGTPLHLDGGAGHKPHVTKPSSQFTAHFHAGDGSFLIDLHVADVDFHHWHAPR
ncbi:hypothetical protein DESC_100055 [Desulfosarcina cetonica]|nr:hypothetical protein DESC_100055 [Desulfosarcina cetonica]